MSSLVADKAKKLIFDCCERYARKLKDDVSNVQLNLHLKEGEITHEGQEYITLLVGYTILHNGVEHQEITFRDLLGLPDIMKLKNKVEPFITLSIAKFAREVGLVELDMETEKNDARIMSVICVCRDKKNVNLYLYKETEYLKEITYDDLFSEETMMEAVQAQQNSSQ